MFGGIIIKNRIKLIISILLIVFTLLTVFQNIDFEVTTYVIGDVNLPGSFDHFRIVQISDLHNCFYDKGNKSIIEAVRKEKPDIIAITGDYVDKSSKNIEELLKFSSELAKIADCYYVTGNHEAEYCIKANYKEYLKKLSSVGFIVIEDDFKVIKRGEDQINIAGLSDPLLQEVIDKKYTKTSEIYYDRYMDLDLTGYTVLLAHRPYDFKTFVKMKPNVILSGHEHGGQFRFPLIGGVFAPGEGFLPEYESGVYNEEITTMIVSRGLGNGEAPIRINNQPEITVIELRK